MLIVIFDPEARDEFLSTVQHYENYQIGLGLRFRQLTEN